MLLNYTVVLNVSNYFKESFGTATSYPKLTVGDLIKRGFEIIQRPAELGGC